MRRRGKQWPLGEYAVRCSVFKVENAGTDNGGSQFRVEEYKKPEFQVTVLPDAECWLLYRSDAADDLLCVSLCGPRFVIKKTACLYIV